MPVRSVRWLQLLSLLALVACAGPDAGPPPSAKSAEAAKSAAGDSPEAQAASGAETPRPTLAELSQLGTVLRQQESWDEALEVYQQANELAPGHPAILQRIAELKARSNDRSGAMAALESLDRLGVTLSVAANPAFAALAEDEDFQIVAAHLQGNAESIANRRSAEVWHRFADSDIWPEGIAVDPASGDLFVGSIAQRRIFRLSTRNKLQKPKSELGAGELQQVVGLWVDNERRKLWAATGETEGDGPSELVAFDVDSEKLTARHPAPDDGTKYALNDVATDGTGRPWVTETFRGLLLTVPAGAEDGASLEPAPGLEGHDLSFANGIEADASGRNLYIGHLGGLSRYDTETGRAHEVASPGHVVAMADGLCHYQNDLILVQNQDLLGQRVIRLGLAGDDAADDSSDGVRVTSLDLLRSGMPSDLLPYTCAVTHYGDSPWLWLLAAADFGRMADETVPAPAVVRVPLSPDEGS